MGEAVLVALISGAVSLIGIIVSAKATRDKVSHKLDTNQQLMSGEINHIKTEIKEMKNDIRSHNHYAELFNENIPVIKEKLSVANNRIKDIEGDIKFYHRRPED